MNKHYVGFFLSLAICISSYACTSAAETDTYNNLLTSESQVLSMNLTSQPEAALRAYKDLLDAMNGFLDQYPHSEHAQDIQDRRERISTTFGSLQSEFDAYKKAIKSEPTDTDLLPSRCGHAVDAWQVFLTRYPHSRFSSDANERKQKWEERLQAELKRGFVLIIEQAEINPTKGPSHGREAGRPWDPEAFGEHSPPDPYVVLSINDQAVAYTPVIHDSLHPHWNQKTDVLHISDDQEIVLLMRDRDVAENVAALALGLRSLFSFQGLAAAQQALKADNDDDIGKWTGTIGELLAKGNPAVIEAGDFKNLRIKVIRP